MTKKEIIAEIEKAFSEHPTIEVVVKDMNIKNTRWGLRGCCLCWDCDRIMVRPWSTAGACWTTDLMKLKKAQLETILSRTMGEF